MGFLTKRNNQDGNTKYPFSFGTMNRAALADHLGEMAARYLDSDPLQGAIEILSLLHTGDNLKIIAGSEELRSVVLGPPQPKARQHGNIDLLLEEAARREEAAGTTNRNTTQRFKKAVGEYQAVIDAIKNGRQAEPAPKSGWLGIVNNANMPPVRGR